MHASIKDSRVLIPLMPPVYLHFNHLLLLLLLLLIVAPATSQQLDRKERRILSAIEANNSYALTFLEKSVNTFEDLIKRMAILIYRLLNTD